MPDDPYQDESSKSQEIFGAALPQGFGYCSANSLDDTHM